MARQLQPRLHQSKIVDMQTIASDEVAHTACDSEPACRFGLLVGTVFRQWRKKVDDCFKAHGLSDATRMPLLVLQDHGQPMLQKDIAQALSLDSSSLVRVLAQLRAAQLVQWDCDPADKRTKRIALTAQGKAVATEILQTSLAIEQALLDGLSEQERDITRRSLHKIIQRFDGLELPVRQVPCSDEALAP